jgi:predicted dehydrogenase
MRVLHDIEVEDMTRVALVGTGKHMQANLLPALRTIEDCTVSAVASGTPDRAEAFAHRWGIPSVYKSYEQLIAAEAVDLIVVAATPQVHAGVAFAATAAGTSVFIEKPPAPDLATLGELCASVRDSASTIDVGYNFRFATAVTNLLQVAEGFGGPDGVGHCRISIAAQKLPALLWSATTVFENFVYVVGIHALELATHLFGEAQHVGSQCTELGSERFHSTTMLRFAGGRTCEVVMTNAVNRFSFDVELFGPSGSGRCSNLSDVEWSIFDESADARPVVRSLNSPGVVGGFQRNGYATVLGQCLAPSLGLRSTDIRHSLLVYHVMDQVLSGEAAAG